jgi:hypothetical protein
MMGLAGPLAEPVAAGPIAPMDGARAAAFAAAGSLVDKVHGFHCRRVLGWDPVAGVYRYHSHKGICRDYKRCLREQKRCIFVLGRGFQPWSYEAFGADNGRYFACMIRAGCY